MTYNEAIETCAIRAACITRREYNGQGWDQYLCYDLARLAATDRGYDLTPNIDIDPVPTNVGAAILKLIDDERAKRGEPRRHKHVYQPRIIQN